jgi:hypothetical protein
MPRIDADSRGFHMGVFKVSCRGGFLRINGMLAVATLLPHETGPC